MYVEDITLDNQTYACFVRSPYAHAEILSVDLSSAAAQSGVIACYTAEDLDVPAQIKPQWVVPGTIAHGRQILARSCVRHVGEPVAVIIAESLEVAADAAALVQVEYEPLEHVLEADAALADGAVQLHADVPNNSATIFRRGEGGFEEIATTAALDIEFDLRNQRLVPFPLECRAINASFDPVSGRMTVFVAQQLPHIFRRMLSETIDFPEHRLRVVSPDVGGGFGAKMHFYPEDFVTALASRRLGRPVKWSERRRENAVATSHGRGHMTTVRVAADAKGKILALKVRSRANVGAYLSTMGGGIPTINVALFVLGVYDIPVADIAVECVYTNTVPTDAYRGAGRPEAAYIIERTIDRVARELGLDPADVRSQNFLKPEQIPHRNVVGGSLDSGRYQETLDRALEISEYRAFGADLEVDGPFRYGVGISNYTETCGVGPSEMQALIGFDRGGYESALVRVQSDGRAVVLSGAHSHGQGHITTFAQIAADALDIPLADVEVIQGDTDRVPQGIGTFNSRSVVVGGSAVKVACERIAERLHKIAAHMLKTEPENVVKRDQVYLVEETNSTIAYKTVCRAAWTGGIVPREFGIGLEENEFYHPLSMSAPYGAHIAKVRVDVETGEIELLSYVAVDDCGTVINPLLARGQVHGGLAQGIGQALFEDGTSDANGRLPTEQAIPRIDMLPFFETEHMVTPSWTNPLGAKGIGEGGAIAAPPAIVNAVLDALWALGVRDLQMPLTPERVLNSIDAVGDER
jgi:carbon-monoxide dehydrogenase large subunit